MGWLNRGTAAGWFSRGRSWGELLLAVWLIVYGIIYFIPNLGIPSGTVLAALALASGVLMLLHR
jgi:hypothetical protein